MESSYLVILPILIITYLIYINIGYKGKVRRYIRKHKLKGKGEKIAIELLRQRFLEKYPDLRDKDTEHFLKTAKSFLVYIDPDYDYEDGHFIVNKKSPLLIPPPPTKEKPYMPPGWENM